MLFNFWLLPLHLEVGLESSIRNLQTEMLLDVRPVSLALAASDSRVEKSKATLSQKVPCAGN